MLLTTCRFFTGFFQVFVTIYFPVWSDTFAVTERQKTVWLTILLMASPLGVLAGYLLTAYALAYYKW